MNTPTLACDRFAADISALVDGELEPKAKTRLVSHMGDCDPCRDTFDGFRRLSRMGRLATEDLDAAVVDAIDPRKLFSGVTRCLVDDKTLELSKLFYELGKAFALSANARLSERERQSVLGAARPIDLRSGESKARRLVREASELETLGEHRRPSGSLFRRSRRLFERRASDGALVRARDFLQEALALDAERDEARLWLGFVFALGGRVDRARIEFRRVYVDGHSVAFRLMGLQSLGKLHSESGDYRRAAECFREVVADEAACSVPGLFPSFLNLAVNCAKAGLHDESVSHFAALTERFPARLAQIRDLIARKNNFQQLLRSDTQLSADLMRRVPALFAA